MSETIRREGNRIALPGFASAHSHAFQRAMRGRTQRSAKAGSFWSWRELMYDLVARLDPESLYAISRFAFAELAMSGVTAVGEFHYLHHAPRGSPYADRIVLADAVIRAARDVGLRICLLRVVYERDGFGRPAQGAQARFVDGDVELGIRDLEEIERRFATDRCVRVGLAPHSVRAVSADTIAQVARYANGRGLPLHMHVSEQERDVEECVAEHDARPVEVLAKHGALSERFVAVHAIHINEHEARELGTQKAFVCVCRTTEGDLGDGSPPVSILVQAGVRFCTGVDSHALTDPFEEARAIELDERTRTGKRPAAMDADMLLQAGSEHGYVALGFGETPSSDRVIVDLTDPALVGAPSLSDAVIFGASPRAVRDVIVNGNTIVQEGRHVRYDEIRIAYEKTLEAFGR